MNLFHYKKIFIQQIKKNIILQKQTLTNLNKKIILIKHKEIQKLHIYSLLKVFLHVFQIHKDQISILHIIKL